jgi:hypothetical protein
VEAKLKQRRRIRRQFLRRPVVSNQLLRSFSVVAKYEGGERRLDEITLQRPRIVGLCAHFLL